MGSKNRNTDKGGHAAASRQPATSQGVAGKYENGLPPELRRQPRTSQ